MKKQLRKELLTIRDKLSINYTKEATEKIFSQLEKMYEFQQAKKIFIYIGFGSEIATLQFLEKHYLEKDIYVPKIEGKDMMLSHLQNLKNLEKNSLGILEPKEANNYIGEIDLVITPAVVFDKNGYRLGYGGGYYDRYFEKNNYKLSIGLCYDQLLVEQVPKESHDKQVDIVLTEERLLKIDIRK